MRSAAEPAHATPRHAQHRQRRLVIELVKLWKIYGSGGTAVVAVRDVSLVVERGDYVAIVGASGSGKSTLMNIIGALDAPTRGSNLLDGVDLRARDETQLAVIRNRKIGFVFQNFNLIPRTSAVRNVSLPLAYAGVRPKEAHERALAALARVALADRAGHTPAELSGGQQQRVAMARALVTNPVLLLADEPTGALDTHSTAEVLALFDELSLAGRTLVVITHEMDVAARAKRVVTMRDGRIVSDARARDVAEDPPGPQHELARSDDSVAGHALLGVAGS
ncbi:MAG: ABC transporter ATP-binding protein [Candidatus Nanopelagicales bacterium]